MLPSEFVGGENSWDLYSHFTVRKTFLQKRDFKEQLNPRIGSNIFSKKKKTALAFSTLL